MTEQELQIIRTIMREELQHIDQRLDGIDQRLDGIDQHLAVVDQRLDGIDQHLAVVDQRLDGIDQRLDALEEGQAELRSGMNILVEWADKTAGSVAFPLPELLEG